MRLRTSSGLAAIVAAACAALPGPALADEPGVHVNPHSPSGTEYALPLDQARGNASGGKPGGGTGGGSSNPASGTGSAPASGPQTGDTPLFGVGVHGARPPRKRKRSRPAKGSPRAVAPEAHVTAGLTPAAAAALDAGDSVTLVLAGFSGIVLLGGAALGILWRRRSTAR